MRAAELLSQGDEVVTGQIADTNAAWLSTRLTELGFSLRRHQAVGDRLADLVAILREIAPRCALCVCTGGLGPTSDDLTAEAVAEAFGAPLVHDPEAMAQIEAMFARYSRRMPEINRKQALLPAGSIRIDNRWGTAPGFALKSPAGAWFVCLPGVPREMKPMFDELVTPHLRERFGLTPGRLVTLRTAGVGESELQERIGTFDEPGIVLGYRTILPENQVKLRLSPDVEVERELRVVARLVAALGTAVFTVEGLSSPIPGVDCGGGELAEVVGRHLAARGATLAVAESCTGGRIAAACTAIPGSSRWFAEGLVTYSNAAKQRLLGVSSASLAAHGAVSEAVAREMAVGCRERSGATWGLAVTGVAGPDGGSEEKPVGTVHLAIASPDGVTHRRVQLGGDRARIQALATGGALDTLRRLVVQP
jgi:nicotinamide-nucleotide amidase